jgi:hypothetical protein
LSLEDQQRMLAWIRRRNGWEAAVVAAFDGFHGALADAITGGHQKGEDPS